MLLPAEIRNGIYASALISDEPLRVCQIVKPLSVFDDHAIDTLRRMLETWFSYHILKRAPNKAPQTRELMPFVIYAFLANPLLMGEELQKFSFL
jgi:hypothetical protein